MGEWVDIPDLIIIPLASVFRSKYTFQQINTIMINVVKDLRSYTINTEPNCYIFYIKFHNYPTDNGIVHVHKAASNSGGSSCARKVREGDVILTDFPCVTRRILLSDWFLSEIHLITLKCCCP